MLIEVTKNTILAWKIEATSPSGKVYELNCFSLESAEDLCDWYENNGWKHKIFLHITS